jgi:hypothetical protein
MTDAGPPGRPADDDAATAPDRRSRTARPLLVLSWLVATVLAGVIAWSAVTVVAGARGEDRAGVVSASDVAVQLAEARATRSPPATEGTPSATDGTPAAAPPATAAATEPADAPTDAGPAVPGPAGQEVARTWDVTGGQVSAACAGATIRLLYATPADGWTVEVEATGPQEVEVRLTRDASRTRVRAECLAGTPELTRNGADDSGGGGGDDSGGDDGGGD